MRTNRPGAALLAVLLSVGAGAGALIAPADAAAKPQRVLEEKEPKQLPRDVDTFKLVGNVYNPQLDGTTLPYTGKIFLQKKTCKACKFKTVKKTKTDSDGRYKFRADVPHTGRAIYRVKVKSNDTYATTKGRNWTLLFR